MASNSSHFLKWAILAFGKANMNMVMSFVKHSFILAVFATLVSGPSMAQSGSARAQYLRAIRAKLQLSGKSNDMASVQKLKELESKVLGSTDADFAKDAAITPKITD